MKYRNKKLFFILSIIGLFLISGLDIYSRPRGGGRGGRGGGRSGRSFGGSGRRGFSRRSPGRNYGSVRHAGTFRGRGPGRIGRGVPAAARLTPAGRFRGRPYYAGLPAGYRRVYRNNRYRYLYDNVYYRRVYHDGGFVYIADD